ncbi:energy transducer TonB [Spirosoma luteum]|uniref:energy transducer TonB n=1 Tax=Spirosoma luteum TaxID=431553 RepID=UPI00037B8876|nr:energy transducer TonB [Spirosoma luteum]
MFSSNTPETVALTYDDIIFQSRHRAYGAFALRQQYKPTLSLALWLGIGLFLLGLATPILYNRFWPQSLNPNSQSMTEVTLQHVAEPPAEQPISIPPAEPAPAVATVRNLPPIVMPEADVVEDVLPATTDQLRDATSGAETAEGTGDMAIIAPPEASPPTVGEKALEVVPKTDEPFVVVEQQPAFPGGMDGLRNFLSKNLNYPRQATSANVSGRVYVSFVVNIDGSLTDIQVLKGIGFGCDEEARRVINSMPRWQPGRQSGRAVRVKFNLPISFSLE